jgi:hypothetical protein
VVLTGTLLPAPRSSQEERLSKEVPVKTILTTLAAGATLLASQLLVAQTTTPSTPSTGTGAGTGTAAQGLPPSTPRDLTGRSPGQMPEQATTPSAPDAIPPSNPTATELESGGTVKPPSGDAGSSGG